jgi:hypothetical protein
MKYKIIFNILRKINIFNLIQTYKNCQLKMSVVNHQQILVRLKFVKTVSSNTEYKVRYCLFLLLLCTVHVE